MDYADALHWWYQRVDFEKRPAGPDDLKLDRMRSLLSRIGNPQDRLRIVHVAGSKGKGSTSAMFEAVARAAGMCTGLFTTPHLSDVSERIQVNGQPISRNELAHRLTDLRPAADAMDDAPTFFELATALAFHHFAAIGVDLAVIEVGLGGRFDSTNVCTPVLSVITSISYDHTAILGDKLSQIAFEKCGIIKPGVPVISGVVDPDIAEVIRTISRERNAPLLELERDFGFSYDPARVEMDCTVKSSNMCYRVLASRERERPEKLHKLWPVSPPVADARGSLSYEINLLGAHQAANASLVVTAARLLNIPNDAVHTGLATVQWPARMEVFAGPPLTILDCAHNIASARTVVETLNESFPPSPRTLIFASSADKDVPGILRTLLPAFDNVIFCQFGDNPRATPPERLLELAKQIRPDMEMTAVETAACGLARQSSLDKQNQIVVITGSVFLAGEVRPLLLAKPG